MPGKAFLLILTLHLPLLACGDGDSSKAKDSSSGERKGPKAIKTCPLQLVDETNEAAVQDEPQCYGGDEYVCAIELLIYQKTNELRASKGALAYSAELSHAAREWSREQASSGKISHDGFPFERYEFIDAEFGEITVTIAAENVGQLFAGKKPDPEFAGDWLANGWWKSPGHKQNILLATTHIGVGVFQAEDGMLYATQLFGCE